MTASKNIEWSVRSFLNDARATPRVWQGLAHTLRRRRSEGIHGKCAFELVSRGLTTTVRLVPNDAGWQSPRLQTLTTLSDSAQRELMKQLTGEERMSLYE